MTIVIRLTRIREGPNLRPSLRTCIALAGYAALAQRKTGILISCCVLASLLFVSRQLAAQGALAQIRQDIRTPSVPAESEADQSSSRDETKHRSWHSIVCDEEEDDRLGNLIGSAATWLVTAPVWVPVELAGDDHCWPGYFSRYPYEHGVDGYMVVAPGLPRGKRTHSLQICSEYADDFDKVSRMGTRVLLDSTSRWGIDSEFNYWRESLAPGQHDDLWTGDANVVFRFAQSGWLQVRAGLGMNWLADDTASDFGVNLTYHADLFPVRPWIVSMELDVGSLGDETLVHGRVTSGLQWRFSEIFIGYDYYEVDQTELNGLVSGLRLWF